MTYDDIFAARERLRVNDIKERAEIRARGYRRLRGLLHMVGHQTKETLLTEAHVIRRNPRGVNLQRFHDLMEAITGDELCW